jgi:hypothetical protein
MPIKLGISLVFEAWTYRGRTVKFLFNDRCMTVYMTVCDFFMGRETYERWTFRNVERSGTVNSQRRWTVRIVQTIKNKRSFAESHFRFTVRSRFKNEQITRIHKENLWVHPKIPRKVNIGIIRAQKGKTLKLIILLKEKIQWIIKFLYSLCIKFSCRKPSIANLIFFFKWKTYFNFFPFRALMITLFTFHGSFGFIQSFPYEFIDFYWSFLYLS